MLLQRRSQIYRSQSVSAAESVFSSVSFLIRIRELLLVLKASKKIASTPFTLNLSPSVGSYIPLLCLLFSLFLFIHLSVCPSISSIFPSFSVPRVLFFHRVAESAWLCQSLLLFGYRLSIFIASRSALFTYIGERIGCVCRSNDGHGLQIAGNTARSCPRKNELSSSCACPSDRAIVVAYVTFIVVTFEEQSRDVVTRTPPYVILHTSRVSTSMSTSTCTADAGITKVVHVKRCPNCAKI